ncbi:MAG: DUF2339 domain-containing protein [Pseudomonadota bacterium]
MEGLLIILVLGIFLGPFILIAVLWGKVNALKRQHEQTTTWLQQQLEGMRQRLADASIVEDTPTPEPQQQPSAASEPEPAPEEPIAVPVQRIEPEPVEPEPVDETTIDAQPDTEPETAAAQAYSAIDHTNRETVSAGLTQLTERWQFDFEDIFGRRLPIWAGGIALAIAGIFLVRYSIEAGLITPLVRVALSFVFGLALIAGAEVAYRFEERVSDDRVRQALAGAGIATLFGAFYLAGTSYGLIGATAAFIGLATVTAGAIALSFRFGLPCAVLGLVGGFAAPVLVDSDSANVPLLALYLALVTGGLARTGEKQGHRWLGYAALAAGLGWGLIMQLAGLDSSADLAALGIYLVVLGSALPAFFAVRGGPSLPQVAAAGIATLQMAVLVDNAGFAPLTWGLYLLIGAALAALGWRYNGLRAGSAIAAFIGLWLLALWPDPAPGLFAGVAAAMATIFAGVPLLHQWRGSAGLLDRAQIAFVTMGIGITAYFQFGSWDEVAGPVQLAAGLAGLATLPIVALALRWRSESSLTHRDDLPLLGAAHALIFGAALLVAPHWTAPLLASALALVMLALVWKRSGEEVPLIAGWSAVAISIFALMLSPNFGDEALRLSGQGELGPLILGCIRWAACCMPLLAMGALRTDAVSRVVADTLAAAIAYGAAAQIVPGDALAWLAAIASTAALTLRENRTGGWATLLVIAGLWALEPLVIWVTAGVLSLSGKPFLADEAIAPIDLALRIAPLLAAACFVVWRAKAVLEPVRYALLGATGIIAAIAVHSLYKLAWSITSLLRFEWYGMGERTIWIAALVAVGVAATRLAPAALAKPARIALLGSALAHFTWFTLVLHNPLHTVQHVGPTPIANWLTAAYGVAIVALILLRDDARALHDRARVGVDIAIMLLVSLLAVSLLRQVFAGSVLTSTSIDQTESLLLSLLGIALALGFLWWGSRVAQRIWRIGSLVLMLVAVLKVFLIDAAGLDGLLRIASFMALGFSLIGIGWVYSRQLRRSEPQSEPDTVPETT